MPSSRSQESRGLWARLRARPVLSASSAVLALVAIVVVLVWFQPQTLLFDTVVDEDFPAVAADADPPAVTDEMADDDGAPDGSDPADASDEPAAVEAAAASPVALATGGFESRSRYTVTGDATVYELEDGSRTLRLEGFESTNGPDLFVYLTSANSADDDGALDADFVDLGVLRGNVGNQNYDIPGNVDLDHYDTVVIWCRRFTVGFGAADLAPPSA